MFVIDAGHGGHEAAGRSSPSGARGPTGLLEKDVTLALARRVQAHLGAPSHLTREHDGNLSLAERCLRAEQAGASVFVSLHAGGAGLPPAETFIHPRSGPASDLLGRAITDGVARYAGPVAALGHGELAVLAPERHSPRTAACLVEVDDLSTPEGERRLRDPAHLDALARGIASGMRSYAGLSATEAPPMASALAASVPWDGPFRIHYLLKTRVFDVTRSSLTVEASASSTGTTAAPPLYNITLEKHRTILPNTEISTVTFPTSGRASYTWNELDTGEYRLVIWIGNTNPYITIEGHVWVRY